MEMFYIASWIIIPIVAATLITASEKAKKNRMFDQHVDEALAIANQ